MVDDWKLKHDSMKEANDQLKHSYFEHMSQIKQESEKLQKQYNLKCQEVEALNNTLIDLEEFSKKQLDLIRVYEKQEYDNSYMKTDDKMESSKYRHLYEEVSKENQELEGKMKSVEQEYLQSAEKIRKQAEIIQILREEVKSLKCGVERKNSEFRQKDQEFAEICHDLQNQIELLQNKVEELSSEKGEQEKNLLEENMQLNQHILELEEQLSYFEQKHSS